MKPNKAVVYMVVGTMAFAVVVYVLVLGACAYYLKEPPDKILTAFKDLAIFASGALAALLSRTGSVPDVPENGLPTPVEIKQPLGEPVPVKETKGKGESRKSKLESRKSEVEGGEEEKKRPTLNPEPRTLNPVIP